jgi:hypothetical protein
MRKKLTLWSLATVLAAGLISTVPPSPAEAHPSKRSHDWHAGSHRGVHTGYHWDGRHGWHHGRHWGWHKERWHRRHYDRRARHHDSWSHQESWRHSGRHWR